MGWPLAAPFAVCRLTSRMHIHLADQHRQGDSLIHRLDPRVKLILTLFFILTVSLTPFGAFAAYGALWLLVLTSTYLAQIGVGFVVRRALVAAPFALAAITLPFTIPGETLATLPIFGGLTMSAPGVIRFVSILIKSWISVQIAVVLVAVTPFPDLLWALRAIHIPQPLIAIVGFMYRYLFLLSDEVLRMLRARSSRCATAPGIRSGGTLWWRGKVAGQMAGSLMIRSFERSERIYNAMLARGYQGAMHTLDEPHLHPTDLAALTIMTLSLTIILLFSHWA